MGEYKNISNENLLDFFNFCFIKLKEEKQEGNNNSTLSSLLSRAERVMNMSSDYSLLIQKIKDNIDDFSRTKMIRGFKIEEKFYIDGLFKAISIIEGEIKSKIEREVKNRNEIYNNLIEYLKIYVEGICEKSSYTKGYKDGILKSILIIEHKIDPGK